jgi:heme A synthase
MAETGVSPLHEFIGAFVAFLLWGISFWRIARQNRGNKVVECGTLAIIVLLAMALLSRVIVLPDWALLALLALLLILCIATVFFFSKETYRALRDRKAKPSAR